MKLTFYHILKTLRCLIPPFFHVLPVYTLIFYTLHNTINFLIIFLYSFNHIAESSYSLFFFTWQSTFMHTHIAVPRVDGDKNKSKDLYGRRSPSICFVNNMLFTAASSLKYSSFVTCHFLHSIQLPKKKAFVPLIVIADWLSENISRVYNKKKIYMCI